MLQNVKWGVRLRQTVRNDLRMENGHDVWNLEYEESVGQGY